MWKRLEKWYNNISSKMTKDRYLDMCEQLGTEPDLDKMPPDIDDFPDVVQRAISVFNILGDRIAADIGYLGKDYSLVSVYLADEENKELFLEVLSWMDEKLIKKSSEEMKRARDKMKK
jgi:hypothetical protein